MTPYSPLPPTHLDIARRPTGAGPLPGTVVALIAGAVMLVTRILAVYTQVYAQLGRPVSYVLVALPFVAVAVGAAVVALAPVRRLGALVVLAAAAAAIGFTEWEIHVIESNGPLGSTSLLRLIYWLSSTVPPILVVLGWGLARRRGALWCLSLVVTAALAAGVKEVGDHALRALAVHGLGTARLVSIGITLLAIATVLAGTLVGWLLERAERPSAKQL
ncbi:hypothetical protein AB3X52_03560 [Nocardioides sp. DS6]|uniref:ABC transporter permease n=1 Tax=Nocardioides eburneus TaxID=3231482 RepID=A0ABV3SXE3_9ACTN